MTAKQFKECFTIAQNHGYDSTDSTFTSEALVALEGIALDEQRRIATKAMCAYVINWQCKYFGGGYDMEELANTREYFKRVDLLD